MGISPDVTQTRIALARGGGAVGGGAHIGVLAALNDAGLGPFVITGTSVGTVVGALYAADVEPAEIARPARTMRWTPLVHPTVTKHALFDVSVLRDVIDTALGGRDFSDLSLIFAAVACDIPIGGCGGTDRRLSAFTVSRRRYTEPMVPARRGHTALTMRSP